MTRKPKGTIMTQTEMIEAGQQKRVTSKVYKQQSKEITDKSISDIVSRGLAEIELSDNVDKIDMSDVNMVKETSKCYLKACANSATLPTMAGFARACGVNRGTLYHWMNKRNDTETGQWIRTLQGLFSDALAESALRNDTNPIVSIFLLKSLYGLQDRNVVEVSQVQYDDDDSDYNPN